MRKRDTYHMLIGFLALMNAVLILIEILIPISKSTQITFYYINNIVRNIFLMELIYLLIMGRDLVRLVKSSILDFLSIISLKSYLIIINAVNIFNNIDSDVIICVIKIFIMVIYVAKFRNRVKDLIRVNRIFYLFIICSLIIIFGAIFISFVEKIPLQDSIWWSFVTFTTVGYGDIMLKTTIGKIIASILMIFGVGFFGVTTTSLALYIINYKIPDKDNSYKGQVVQEIKGLLDNYKDLTQEDINFIVTVIKSLKDNK